MTIVDVTVASVTILHGLIGGVQEKMSVDPVFYTRTPAYLQLMNLKNQDSSKRC